MKELFDPTKVVTSVARYIAHPEHPHDNVCFYGLPFAHNKEHIAKIRLKCAKAVRRFGYMNHCGLNSNCSSFAEYLRSGAVINILKAKEYLSYFGDLFHYAGQHLTFGDIVGIQYLKDEWFSNGIFDSELKGQRVHDFAEGRRQDARRSDFLKAYASQARPSSGREKFQRADLLRLRASLCSADYHFLMCVGYEINDETGNLEPVFIGQDGKNVRSENDAKDRRILLPPFGDLQLCFLSLHVRAGKKTPALMFCSKPI